MTTIGDYAFGLCSALTDVYCYATEIPATGTDIFNDVDLENSKLYVPSESVDNYKTTHPWSGFAYILPLDEETDVPDVKSSSLLISCADGVINISGGKDGMVVYAYTLDGVVVGSALIENGSASIAASVPDGSLLIISMGDEYTKVMM